MKKILALAGSLILYVACFSQMHISTNMRQDYTWNAEKQEWTWAADDPNMLTFLEFNKEMTTFKHTTPTITSAYIIKSFERDQKDDHDQYLCDIMSDVGNKYFMIIDIKNNELRFIGTSKDGSKFLVKHTIKRVWFDE